MFPLIKELTELSGPVGQEQIVLDRVTELWEGHGATVERDALGNLTAHVGGAGKRTLLVAHADELCYLVRAIHPDGFLWLANGQGWSRTLSFRDAFTLGQRVRVLARHDTVPGVISSVTGHLATIALPEPSELTWNDIWVDTGLSREELVKRGVTPGTRIVWEAETKQWGNVVVGKALDDRVPVAVLTELLRRVSLERLSCDLTLACTVQEEIGVVGATALATSIAPEERFDAVVALEVGMGGDVPGVPDHAVPLKLGKGPALVHKDSLVHYDHALTKRLEQVACEANIAIQHAVFGSFGSDGAAFMRAGMPSALVAFPTRYTHTPFEMGHLRDIERLVDWLVAFVSSNQ